MTNQEIGKRVEKIRLSLKGKPNKEQFGKLVGISGQSIGKIERGELGISRENLINICQATGASADYILLGKEISNIDGIRSLLSSFNEEQINTSFEILKILMK